jgi:M6 family metalloprotease-like protein
MWRGLYYSSIGKSNLILAGSRLCADLLFAHEYGHASGLPDLDHNSGMQYAFYATGGFGLMANINGFGQHQDCVEPWFRMSGSDSRNLGWVNPINATNMTDQEQSQPIQHGYRQKVLIILAGISLRHQE